MYLAASFAYLAVVMGLAQRLILLPLFTLFPSRRRRWLRGWMQLQARMTLRIARTFANLRMSVQGAIEPVSCVVIMNHQSVLDIPLAVSLMPGPLPLIPTRDRYRRGIPGISPLARMCEMPFVSQGRTSTRAELQSLLAAAELVARGERSLLIYPEGHRTKDGEIAPFMTSGLRLLLQRARQPVYAIVVDGMWRARTVADTSGFLDMNARATVLGPFPPPSKDEIDSFIESLRCRMIDALAELRAS